MSNQLKAKHLMQMMSDVAVQSHFAVIIGETDPRTVCIAECPPRNRLIHRRRVYLLVLGN